VVLLQVKVHYGKSICELGLIPGEFCIDVTGIGEKQKRLDICHLFVACSFGDMKTSNK
jgi:hypothetical protein